MQKYMQANKLYVGNLSYGTTGDTLKSFFAAAGSVTNTSIITDKMTGRSRGFGFVEMSTDAEAQKAVEMFDGKEMDGRKLVVNVARPMTERAPRSGGYR